MKNINQLIMTGKIVSLEPNFVTIKCNDKNFKVEFNEVYGIEQYLKIGQTIGVKGELAFDAYKTMFILGQGLHIINEGSESNV